MSNVIIDYMGVKVYFRFKFIPRLLVFTILFLQACASQTVTLEQTSFKSDIVQHRLNNCTLQVRVIGKPETPASPVFVMLNGVPFSSAIYQKLADELQERISAVSFLIDLPGTGGSSLNDQNYTRHAIRECVQSYISTLQPHTLILDDLAILVAFPLLEPAQLYTNSLVILNAPIKPSGVSLPFPMNLLSCCPTLGVGMGSITPQWFFHDRIKEIGISRQALVSDTDLQYLYEELHSTGGLSRLANLLSELKRNEASDLNITKGLATPIPQLFIWGEADPTLGNEYKNLLPLTDNQRLIIYPDAKHFLMLDYYKEIANSIVDWRN